MSERTGQEWIRTTEGRASGFTELPIGHVSKISNVLKTNKLQRKVARDVEDCARDCASSQGGESNENKGKDITPAFEGRWKFLPVLDSRNRKIKGLSQRNGRIYGTIWVSRGDARSSCRRFPLLDEDGRAVITISAAKTSYERLRGKAREEKLPLAGQKPSLADFAAEYLTSASTQSKRPRTIKKEGQSLGLWVAVCGSIKIDKISTPTIRLYIEKRLKGTLMKGRRIYAAASPRTVAIDIIALRNVLKTALDAGFILEIPRFPKLKVPPPPRRSLVSDIDFQRLIAGCSKKSPSGEPVTKNGTRSSLDPTGFVWCERDRSLLHHMEAR